MPSLFRTLLAVLHAATFIALSGPSYVSTCVSASPLAMPLPFTAADWTHNTLAHREPKDATIKSMRLKHGVAHNQTDATRVTRTARNNLTELSSTPRERRQIGDINILNGNLISILDNYYKTTQGHASNMEALSEKSSNPGSSDPDTQENAKDEATGLQTSLLGLQTILVELAADKGLANYDKSSELETILKNLINALKDLQSYLTKLVQQYPILGPILGPIIYLVKCLIDQILDILENLTDGLLNATGLNI